MGCGLSQFERRRHEGGEPTTTAFEFDPPPQPQVGIDSEVSVKERETSPPTPQPRLGRGGGEKGLGRINVERRPTPIKDIGHDLGDGSFIRYPRSPSFRDYCADSELPFGDAYDSSPDNDGYDIDSPGADGKFMSKSTMSSPKSHAKVTQSGGSNDELTAALAAKTECEGTASPSRGLKMRNDLSGKRKWRGKQARIRAYIKASRWQKLRTNKAVVKNE